MVPIYPHSNNATPINKHVSLCTDTDNDGFSFILVNHEESADMSYELLILLKFKLLQYLLQYFISTLFRYAGETDSN